MKCKLWLSQSNPDVFARNIFKIKATGNVL